MTGIPNEIIQPIYITFNKFFQQKSATKSNFDRISMGLCHDVPIALKGFAKSLDKLNNLDKRKMSPLERKLFEYLYINEQRVINVTETPINLIDKVDTYNTIKGVVNKQ